MRDHTLLEPLSAFRTPDAPRLLAHSAYGSTLALTEVSGPAGHGMTTAIPPSRGYLVQLRLRDCPGATYFSNGRPVSVTDFREGAVQFHDLRQDPRVELASPFHVMHMNVQLAVLDEVVRELSLPPIEELQSAPGHCHRDGVIEHLLRAMRPALARPLEVSSLFLDQVSTALCVHLVEHYAGTPRRPQPIRGGLSPWQARIVREMLHADLDRDLPLAALASACGLSMRHFTRAVKQTLGVSAHQYRMRCRIDHARTLLLQNRVPISEVALACGFASQAHFARNFQAACGISPSEWRRQFGSAPFVSKPLQTRP